jgi:6-phosphogluconolactonase
MPDVELQVFESVEALQSAAARHIAATLAPTLTGRVMHMALSGGNTPRRMHEFLAESAGIDWSHVHVYWGDERTVGPDHQESNFRMARESLLDRVDIPAGNIHRMRGEADPDEAAQEYEQILREMFDIEPPALPRLDINVLGVGDDGHTASLFPGTAALKERERWVVANVVPQQDTTRITLTYPVLNNAALTLFLVSGSGKAEAVRRVLSTDEEDKPPAAFVQPEGDVIWFLDQEAAAAISR